MSKLIITPWQSGILTALISDKRAVSLNYEPASNSSELNNIYIGKVKNIVRNIDAAFVEYGDGRMGYYSLTENRQHIFADRKPHDGLRSGDEIVVQVVKDSVKTKAPVLSCYLNFTGKYCVLTAGKPSIGFSGKLTDQEKKADLKSRISKVKDGSFGVIVRTNAQYVEPEAVLAELELLKSRYTELLEQAPYRTCYSMLFETPPAYVTSIRDSYSAELSELLTDGPELYAQMKGYLEWYQPEDLEKLRFYEDESFPLTKLYSLDTAVSQALNKKVWLKSGGYLVIEPTEALVVIDVNTGKYSGRKNQRDTILKINQEAAVEIAYQMRLRNLSGIIIVDFIDMEESEDRELLMRTLEKATAADPVKTTVVGISKLNLVEMTRKKIRRPFYEQLQAAGINGAAL